ncbi:MAG TPA: DNA alkylation repair protein [Bryobacteraceae bacterium]|jgi:3-methyladenine DNA glycosylase AlkD|nr:DNA alkylation repair protein [Bryobacteraceae bacterium]
MTKTNDVLKRLRAAGSAANIAGMARYGIRPAIAYGVSTPVIRSIAKELRGGIRGSDSIDKMELASALWSTNVLEARMLATMIADPLQIPEEEVERWVREFDCWSVCDSACIGLLWRTPFAWRKLREWSRREPEYERRAAFALLAGLAVHDKKATDGQFRSALRLIAKAARDDRNFVKKAVNWALRQIGKRNPELREAAIETAESLIATGSRSARWIGHDALRELRRQATPRPAKQ